MSPRLFMPVLRKVATVEGPVPLQVDLANWCGVRLMLHLTVQVYVAGEKASGFWSCSHEPTGMRISTGSSPEAALAQAITRMRENFGHFRDNVATKPVLNP